MKAEKKQKIALITGASRGIGQAAAIALAKQNMHIIAVARTTSALEELDDQINQNGATATLVPLDLNDRKGINRLGGAIHERWGKLDILIGNAAILGRLTPVNHIEEKEWDDVFAVNVTANYQLIRAMYPILMQAENPRAIFLTSQATQSFKPYWSAYAASKSALETLIKIWAAETQKTKLKANLLNPGHIRTKMRAKAVPGENPQNVPQPNVLNDGFVFLTHENLKETGQIYDFQNGLFIKREEK